MSAPSCADLAVAIAVLEAHDPDTEGYGACGRVAATLRNDLVRRDREERALQMHAVTGRSLSWCREQVRRLRLRG